ncbi:hypothetical protein [uncultured Ruminococcus sp.]|uniref:hypothetical protein n=1 Tax=uncultured Ruminococcus sp. TaxID=165186 RepID=UPI0025E767E2|nr:hypothetical protein [uncultured Ruminococcus sp.]
MIKEPDKLYKNAIDPIINDLPPKKVPRRCANVIKLTENEKEAGVCLYVSERTPAITYTKMA